MLKLKLKFLINSSVHGTIIQTGIIFKKIPL